MNMEEILDKDQKATHKRCGLTNFSQASMPSRQEKRRQTMINCVILLRARLNYSRLGRQGGCYSTNRLALLHCFLHQHFQRSELQRTGPVTKGKSWDRMPSVRYMNLYFSLDCGAVEHGFKTFVFIVLSSGLSLRQEFCLRCLYHIRQQLFFVLTKSSSCSYYQTYCLGWLSAFDKITYPL